MTVRPQTKPDADKWVESRQVSEPEAMDIPMKRLTIDIPADLHTRFKVSCASQGKRMADVLRQLIEQETTSQ